MTKEDLQQTPMRRIFMNMADNLTKIKFRVFVRESYVPVTHYAWLPDEKENPNPPPPVRQVTEGDNADDICVSQLSTRYIVDALANGHYLEFDKLEDMRTVRNWLSLYIDQCEQYAQKEQNIIGDAFYQNAKKVLGMMNGNIKRWDAARAARNPEKPSIVELLNLM